MRLETTSTAPPPPLLHNMSCRPDTTIINNGKDQCVRIRFALEIPRTSIQAPPPAGQGPPKPIVVNGISLQFGKTLEMAVLCPLFGISIRRGDDPWQALRDFANEPCPELALLPAAASVSANTSGRSIAGLTDNPRLQLAVLARCSAKVFIRDWPPVISIEKLTRDVTLIAPAHWKPQ